MRLAFEDQGAGPVVVLLHGFPFDRSLWAAQVEWLRGSYRVIVPDLRGHGASPAPEGIYAMSDLASDVVELLDGLLITEPVVVGGLSMGGYVALALAVEHPERLRGLMLINTRSAADTPQTVLIREELAREVETSGNVGSIVATMLPRLFSPKNLSGLSATVSRIEGVMRQTTPRGIAGSLRGMAIRPDRTADLQQIELPTLILAGADDQLIPIEEASAMARALPGATLVVVPAAGHLAPVENPSVVNDAIGRFLSGLA